MVHGSIYFIQMAVDLNNAIGGVVQSLGGPLTIDTLPWSGSMSAATVSIIQGSQDLFHALFAIGVVVAVVILVLSYVIRTAMLDILVVLAPLAALCSVSRRRVGIRPPGCALHRRGLHAGRAVDHPARGHGRRIRQRQRYRRELVRSRDPLDRPQGSRNAARGDARRDRCPTAVRHARRSMHKALMPAHHVMRHRTPSVIRAAAAITAVIALGLCGGTVLASGVTMPDTAGATFVKPLTHSWISQGFGCTSFSFEPIDLACPGGHWHSGMTSPPHAGRR